MQVGLSPMAKNIRSSLMFRFLEKAKEMEGKGIEVIHLEKGEPEFGPPKGAIEAAKRAMDEGHNILTPSPGIKELREAITDDLSREYRIHIDPLREVVVVPGAKFGVYAAIASIILPGDEVLCHSPFFPPHREIVEMLGGRFIPVPLLRDGECGLSAQGFEERMTQKTRILLLSYPHNPTGWVPSEREIDLLRHLVEKNGLVVVSDEVYDRIIFDGYKHRPFFGFPELHGQLILVNSFSKRFAMTGWRIGYCAGPSEVINGIVRIQQNTTTCANSASQKAAVFALKEEKAYSEMLARVYGERKNVLLERLNEIRGLNPIPPKGSLFIFISIAKIGISSTQFADELLEEAHVALAPGAAFGEEWDQYVRISMTEDFQKISEALDRLGNFVGKRI
jgi:aspartate/methionine/tyrosine aminotransferase